MFEFLKVNSVEAIMKRFTRVLAELEDHAMHQNMYANKELDAMVFHSNLAEIYSVEEAKAKELAAKMRAVYPPYVP